MKQKLKEITNTIYWNLYIRKLAIRQIFKTNLGNEVKYRNNIYEVCNGNRQNSWRLEPSQNLPNDGWVLRSECQKVLTLKNIIQSYCFSVSFYSTNWLDIWKREGIKDWMRGCKIW